MNGNHATGGTLGLLVGFVAARYGFHVPDQEAGIIGLDIAGFGGVLAHLATGPGIVPAIRRAILGAKQPVPPGA